jgi:hypothetical protein
MQITPLKIGAIAGLAVVGAAVPLAIQHQSISALREENRALTQQVQALAELQADNETLSNRLAQAGLAAEATRSDMARLRGEVTRLRGMTNELAGLRQQNATIRTAQAGAQAQATVAAQNLELMMDAKVLTFALLMQTEGKDRFPGTFANAATFYEEQLRKSQEPGEAPPDPGRFAQATNNFEIVYEGSIRALRQPATTILLRERQARQLPDGRWAKTYAFTDGHAETHVQSDSNFAPFEDEHLFKAQ